MALEYITTDGESFLLPLFSLYKIRYLYAPAHPKFNDSLQPVMEAIGKILSSRKEATFLIVENEFIFEGNPQFRTLPRLREFTEIFSRFHIQRFTFFPGITKEEIISFINLLTSKPEKIKEQYGFEGIPQAFHLSHILLERLPTTTGTSDVLSEYSSLHHKFSMLPSSLRKEYSDLYHNISTFISEISKGEGGDLTILSKQIDQSIKDIYDLADDFTDCFITKKMQFGDFDHEINVCLLTLGFARWLKMDLSSIQILCMSALLHDLGKMFLPETMRDKMEETLTPEETKSYWQHPLWGAEYLMTLENAPPLVITVCYEHHVGYDKSGFPALPKDIQPCFGSLLVSMVERYERLIRTDMVSRELGECKKELSHFRGLTFEPRIFDLFFSYIQTIE
ncbi:HD domain-containing protein [Candidatus Sumerlaeota bacterium]|nr:HD domain-containing protein [Candidatus Sumerlaeota bacterium]